MHGLAGVVVSELSIGDDCSEIYLFFHL
jgi:hypothetical protein